MEREVQLLLTPATVGPWTGGAGSAQHMRQRNAGRGVAACCGLGREAACVRKYRPLRRPLLACGRRARGFFATAGSG